MKKIVIYYPYNTGEKAFSGGVAKVIVSNIIAVYKNGDIPYAVMPEGNIGLAEYIEENCSYCKVVMVPMGMLALFSDTKNPFTRCRLIVKNLIGVFRGRQLLKKALEEIQPDAIHYHEINCYNLFGLYTKCKVVFHIHSYRFTSYKFVAPRIYKAVNKYVDEVIIPTQSIVDAVAPYIKKHMQIVNTPYLDLGSSAANVESPAKQYLVETKQTRTIFSFVGRICTIKRVDHFLKAMALLPEVTRKKMMFVIVGGCNFAGDFAYKEQLGAIIKENNLQDSVNFIGYVNPIEVALSYIDYGVMLTESEAMPMTGIEFMKFNIPIVAYAAPGIADFMENEENGFLIENGNIEAIAKVLERILTGDDIPDFTKTIPSHFAGYSVDAFAETIKEIYK